MIDYESLTGKQVAAIWGVVPMTVSLWYSRDGCPRNDDGTYDLAAVVQWREARLAAKAEAEAVGPDGKFNEFQLRKQAADADAAEFRYAVMKKQFYPTVLIDQWFFGLASGVKARLLAIPSTLAPELYGRDIASIDEILMDTMESVLRELCEATKPQPDEADE